MKRLLFLTVFVCAFAFTNCKNRCESVKTGEITLLESSASLAPYNDGDSLTYVNSHGDEMILVLERNHSLTDRNCVKYRCELTTGPYEDIVCDYWNSESVQNLYWSGDSIFIDILAYMTLYEEENTLFVDALRLYMSEISRHAQGEAALAPRFEDPVYNESQVYFLEELEFSSSVNLLETYYENVWHTSTDDENMIWAQTGKGLIGYMVDGEIWNLQE